MTPARDIRRLLEIMAALRDPQTGCPWDVEQDFRSIAPYTIEEVHEVVDAIERDDLEDLREELGDLLLQVVFHAQMADEKAAFDFGDVVEGITRKMIRRHPHVFGDDDARSAGMAKGMWEKIKSEEKREKAQRRKAMGLSAKSESTSILDDVPAAMPAPLEALKLQQKAAKVGFDWDDIAPVFAKVREELDELEAAIGKSGKDDIEQELGDTLFSLVNLARHLAIDPDAALRRTNAKFRSRFANVERALTNAGGDLLSADLDQMEAEWQRAKAQKA